MPRKRRTREPDLTYHTRSRCIENRDMITDHFKEIMLRTIEKAQGKYKFEFIHYAILDNHFHFIIRTVQRGSDISSIMQYIKARFAETYNKSTGRSGTFWSERFKDIIVENQPDPRQYFLSLMWHTGYKPVKKGIIPKPELYKYSTIRCYLEKGYYTSIRITYHTLFQQLGNTFTERAFKFRQWGAIYRVKYADQDKMPDP